MRRKQFIRNKHQLGKRAGVTSLKRYCFEIWSELVRTRDNHRCVFCGKETYVQAHHLISRKFLPTAFNSNNGLSLCCKCHTLGLVSIHHSQWIFDKWLKDNRKKQYRWFLENRYKMVDYEGTKTSIKYYRDILKNLLNEFEILSPETMKKSRFVPFSDKEEKLICDDYVENMLSRRDLSAKYGVNEQVIETILKRGKVIMRRVGRQNGNNN